MTPSPSRPEVGSGIRSLPASGAEPTAALTRLERWLWRWLGRRSRQTEPVSEFHDAGPGRVEDICLLACPQPLLCVGADGLVEQANAAAASWFDRPDANALRDCDMGALLGGASSVADHGVLWCSTSSSSSCETEGRDERQRRFSLRITPRALDGLALPGCYVWITDRTAEFQAVQQRDAALKLLNHDLRAPQSSILTLIELWRLRLGSLSEVELLAQVETNALSTLSMSDDFVQYVRAHDAALQRVPIDLNNLAAEAVDDLWVRSRERKVQIRRAMPATARVPGSGDPEKLQRAMANMLRHAVARSPGGAIVRCAVRTEPDSLVFEVTDHGAHPGAAVADPALEADLLASRPDPATGISWQPPEGDLVLAYAALVARRHGGHFRQRWTSAQGLMLSLSIPAGGGEDIDGGDEREDEEEDEEGNDEDEGGRQAKG